ncbi:MAG: ATP-binding protein, partial [Acidobacteriota bacterium]|nr:ATP-binding protein [Acidobacteriota bacterium]
IPPPLAITEFSLYGQPVPVQNDRQDSPLKKNISEAQGLTLTHENDVFSLEFAALDFINPKKNRYAYKLVGFDKDWTETDARGRTATYTGLAPGQYRFEVKGSNSDGLWNEEGTSLDITILPAPWKTWWAKSLYVLAFIATVLGIANLISSRKKLRDERLARERLDQLVAERTRTLQEKQNQLVSQAEQLEYQAGQLREMDALKTRFFTNISHELRTPLSLIIGNLTEMQGKGDFSDLTQASLRHAVELTDLVEQFLDVSKIDAGCLQMKPCRQDILPLARDTVSSFLPLAERKGILLRFCVEEGPLVFTFDSDHLRKVINNLLANAFRHTSKGGKIWVSIQRRELQAVIEVQDTGCGIPEHHLPHIFDRFYQVGNPGRGTGIGLSYARDLVALHGGQIEVDSKPGFGSRFTVKLPLDRPHFSKTAEQGKPRLPVIAETASPEKHQGDREDASEADVHRPRVLIVEDHLELRAFLKRHLQKQYAVLEADNGEEGLQSALSTVPDLIISDIMMPAMDGIELCKRLRKRKQTAHIPILLLTAKVEQADEIAGLQAGADDYVRKPFDLDTLLIRVDHLLQTHRLADSAKIVFEPTEVEVPSQGEVFMERLTEILDRNLSDERFNVSELSEEMGLSPRHLRRKLRALTGKPTAVLIREYRLKRAAQLLRRHAGNVSEIAYMVGFHKPDYFSTLYKEFHGESPSEAITRGADL